MKKNNEYAINRCSKRILSVLLKINKLLRKKVTTLKYLILEPPYKNHSSALATSVTGIYFFWSYKCKIAIHLGWMQSNTATQETSWGCWRFAATRVYNFHIHNANLLHLPLPPDLLYSAGRINYICIFFLINIHCISK